MVEKRQVIKQLPSVLQTETLQKFAAATMDHLFQPQKSETVSGYVGRYPAYADPSKDFYIEEPTKTRRDYSLEPITISRNTDTASTTHALFYDDLINHLRFQGGKVDDHNRLFNNEFYSWCPPVDIDKIMNFKRYYWVPNGPDPVEITSTTDLERELVGLTTDVVELDVSYRLPTDDPDGTPRNGFDEPLVLTSGMRVVVRKDVNADKYNDKIFIVEGVGVSVRLVEEPDVLKAFRWDDLGRLTDDAYVLFLDDPNTPISEVVSEINGRTQYEYVGRYKRASSDNAWRPFDPMNPPSSDSDPLWEASLATPNEPLMFEENMRVIFVTYGFEPVNRYIYNNRLYKITGVGEEIKLRTEPFGWDSTEDTGWGGASSSFSTLADYIVMERDAKDGNPWSRNNRWFHEDVISPELRGTDGYQRAERPIIEFQRDLELFNYGLTRIADVDVKEDRLTYSQINSFMADNPDFILEQPALREAGVAPLLLDVSEGSKNWVDVNNDPSCVWYSVNDGSTKPYVVINSPDSGDALTVEQMLHSIVYINDQPVRIGYDYTIENNRLYIKTENPIPTTTKVSVVYWDTAKGILIRDGLNVMITNDPNPEYNNRVYRISGIKSTGRVVLSPLQYGDDNTGLPNDGDVVRARYGFSNLNRDFQYIDGEGWVEVQRKNEVNQAPLFNLYDIDGVALDDPGRYPESNFDGNKIFSFTDVQSSAVALDAVLNKRVKINSDGQLVYGNYLFTDRYSYTLQNTEITGYYFHRTIKDDGDVFSNDWYLVDEPSRQYINHTYTTTSKQTEFEISYNLTEDEISSGVADIQVVRSGVPQTIDEDYAISGSVVRFAVPVDKNELVSIRTYAPRSPDNMVGVYEVPLNLQANPDWNEVSEISYTEFFDHFVSILQNQNGFDGNVFGANNYRDTLKDRSYGRVILQHRAPLLKTMVMASDQNIDLMLSVQYAEHEFVRFRNKFIRKIKDLYDNEFDREVEPAVMVDTALASINVGKTTDFAFAYSQMVPGINDYKVFEYSLNAGTNVETYTVPTTEITNDQLSSSFVYLKRPDQPEILLQYGWDYTVSEDEITILTYPDLNEDDLINIVLYEGFNTYVPPSPSHMGVYSMYRPSIEMDNTFVNPRPLINCHDGSVIELFDEDYASLNAAVLEFENRIYNASPRNFSQRDTGRVFDHRRYVSGKFRTAEYSYQEWNEIIQSTFERWATMNRVEYRENTTWIPDNPFTWNYRGIEDRLGEPLAGNWRGIYLYYFDTDRPHTHPWEMLGLTQKPQWWDEYYGVAPYTRGNTRLWNDIENGIIAEGEHRGEYTEYKRDGLADYIPVDDEGNLLDPMASGIASRRPTASEAQREWEFGDHGPVETAWRRSGNFPFAVVQGSYLLKPARLVEYCWDTIRLKEVYHHQDKTRQWVFGDIRARRPHSYLTVHGEEITSPEKYIALGVQQWVSDYVKSRGQDVTEIYGNVIRGIDVRLGHKMAGFVNQDTMQIRADNFGFMPQENYNTFLYRSPSISDHTYSGVIIEWDGRGWKVFGYDTVEPFFNTIPGNVNGSRARVSVGREAEGRPWVGGVVYSINDVVNIGGVDYKAIEEHKSSRQFEDDSPYWAPVNATTQNTGISVSYYKEANRQGNIRKVPYGTVFYTQQEVFDFLMDYSRWLESQGWVYEDLDYENDETYNWLSAAKDYLFWTLTRWSVGSTIALSPAAQRVKFVTEHGEIQNIERIVRGVYSMLDRDGFMIQPNNTVVSRIGNEVTITAQNDIKIHLARLFVNEVEHVIIFDNETIFGDLIYDPVFNLRQPRLRLSAARSQGWNGRVDAPGFIVTGNRMFANFEKSVDDFRHLYDIEHSVNDPTLRDYAWHVVGFEGRQYLDDLLLDDKTQFQFIQNAMKQKGTTDAMKKLLRSVFVSEADEVKFFDEWAFRAGNYGGTSNKLSVEFLLRQREMRTKPQLIEFKENNPIIADLPNDDVINIPLDVQQWEPNTQYSKYEEVARNNKFYSVVDAYVSTDDFLSDLSNGNLVETANRWMVKPERELVDMFPHRKYGEFKEGDILTAGYVKINEADYYATDLDDLDSIFTDLLATDGGFSQKDRVWVYDYIAGEWMMFNVQALSGPGVFAQIVEYFDDDHAIITTSAAHGLNVGDLIIITDETGSTPDARGIHHVKSIEANNQFTIEMYVDSPRDWNIEGGDGPAIVQMVPYRFVNMAAVVAGPLGWANGDMIFVDDYQDGRWAVLVHESGSWTIERVENRKIDTNLLGNAVIYNKETNRIDQFIGVFDPVKGAIPGQADANIWYKIEMDPAIYNNGDPETHKIIPEHAWNSIEEGRLWWDLSTVRYLDYEIGDSRYRRNVWGKIAPRTSIDVYEWTRSDTPPTAWANQVELNKGLPDDGTIRPTGEVLNADNPAWCEQQYYDDVTDEIKTEYFFWVKNKTTIPTQDFRTMSSRNVARMIENPLSFELPWYAVIDDEATLISSIDHLLTDEDTVMQINYRRKERDDNIHRQWILMRDGDARSQPDENLWRKMSDSMVGFNHDDLDVPEPTLSAVERFGTLFRPRQTWFDDRYMARKIFVEKVNAVLRSRPIIDSDSNWETYFRSYDGSKLSRTFKSAAPLNVKQNIGQVGIDAQNLGVVELASSGVDVDIDLFGGDFVGTIDREYVRDGQRVLIKDQSVLADNGIYDYHADTKTFVRASNVDLVYASNVTVLRGHENRDTTWINVSANSDYEFYQTVSDNEYHYEVDSFVERDELEIDGTDLQRGQRVLVNGTEETQDFWTVWRYEGEGAGERWTLERTQTFNTADFWESVDWYADGLSDASTVDNIFASEIERDIHDRQFGFAVGAIVKIDDRENDTWYWQEYLGKRDGEEFGRWEIVARKEGTIELSDKFYDTTYRTVIKSNSQNHSYDDVKLRDGSLELRQIISSLVDEETFMTDAERNDLFFAMIHYVHSEQGMVDWALKTSFLFIKGINEPLMQEPVLRKENTESIIGFVNEIKPYHTKIRDFTLSRTLPVDVGNFRVTDFDKPIYPVDRTAADHDVIGVTMTDDGYEIQKPFDENTFTDSRHHRDWFANFEKYEDDPYLVRNFKTTICFDRIKWIDWYVSGEADLIDLYSNHYGTMHQWDDDRAVKPGDRVFFHNYDDLNLDHWKLYALSDPNTPARTNIARVAPSTRAGYAHVQTIQPHNTVGNTYNMDPSVYDAGVSYDVGDIIHLNDVKYICVEGYVSSGDFETEKDHWSDDIEQYPTYVVIPQGLPEVTFFGDGRNKEFQVPFRMDPDDLQVYVDGRLLTWEARVNNDVTIEARSVSHSDVSLASTPEYEIVTTEKRERTIIESDFGGEFVLKATPYHSQSVSVRVKRVQKADDWSAGVTYNENDMVMYNSNIFVTATAHTSTTFANDSHMWEPVSPSYIDVPHDGFVQYEETPTDPVYKFTIEENIVRLNVDPHIHDTFMIRYKTDADVRLRINETPKEGQSIYVRRGSSRIMMGSYRVVRYIDEHTFEVEANLDQEYIMAQDNLAIDLLKYRDDVMSYVNDAGETVTTVIDHTLDTKYLTEAERIQLAYRPTEGMPSRDIRELLELNFKGTLVDGGDVLDTTYSHNVGDHIPVLNEVYNGQSEISIRYWQNGWDNSLGWGDHIWDSIRDMQDNDVIRLEVNGVVQTEDDYDFYFDEAADLWKIRFITLPTNGDMVTLSVVPNYTVEDYEMEDITNATTRYYDMNVLGGTFSAPAPTASASDTIVDGGLYLPGPVETVTATEGQTDFVLTGEPIIGVVNTVEDLNWHVRVFKNNRRIFDGYRLEHNSGDEKWHVIFDDGQTASDEIRFEMMGKTSLQNPFFGENRPQELVPARATTNFGISVYTEASVGAPNILSTRYVGDGSTQRFDIKQKPASTEAVFVAVEVDGVTVMLRRVNTFGANWEDEFIVHWEEAEVELGFVPTRGATIKITSFSAGGTNLENMDTFTAIGSSDFTLTKTLAVTPNLRVWIKEPNSETTVEIPDGNYTFSNIGRNLTINPIPMDGSLITATYEIEDDVSNDFQNNQMQRIAEVQRYEEVDGVLPVMALVNPEGITYTEQHVFVIRDGEIVESGDYSVVKVVNDDSYQVQLGANAPTSGSVIIVAYNTPNTVKVRTQQYSYASAPITLNPSPSPSVPPHGSAIVWKKVTGDDMVSDAGNPAGTTLGMPLTTDSIGKNVRLMPPATRYFLGDGGNFLFRFDRPIDAPHQTKIWLGQNSTALEYLTDYVIPTRYNGILDIRADLPTETQMDLVPGDYFTVGVGQDAGYDEVDGLDPDDGFDNEIDDSDGLYDHASSNWFNKAFNGTWAIYGQGIPNPSQPNTDNFGFEEGDIVVYLGQGRWSQSAMAAGSRSDQNYTTNFDRAVAQARREIHFFTPPAKNIDVCFVWYEDGKYDYDIIDGELHLYAPTFTGLTLMDNDEITVTTFSNDSSVDVRTEVFTASDRAEYAVTRIPWNSDSMWVDVNGQRQVFGTDYNLKETYYGWDMTSYDSFVGWDGSKSRPVLNFFDNHPSEWRVAATTFMAQQTRPAVGFQMHKNDIGDWEHLRIADANKTKLVSPIRLRDKDVKIAKGSAILDGAQYQSTIVTRRQNQMTQNFADIMVDVKRQDGSYDSFTVTVMDSSAGGASDGIITHNDIVAAINADANMQSEKIEAALFDSGGMIVFCEAGTQFVIKDTATSPTVTAFFGASERYALMHLNQPEAVYVNGERIVYTDVDLYNIPNRLLNIQRGTNGSASGVVNEYRTYRVIADGSDVFDMPEWFMPLNDTIFVSAVGDFVREYHKDDFTVIAPSDENDVYKVKFAVAPTDDTAIDFSCTMGNWMTSDIVHQAGSVVIDAGEKQIIPGGYRWEGLLDAGWRGQLDAIEVGTHGCTEEDQGKWYWLSRSYDMSTIDIRIVAEHDGIIDPETGEPEKIIELFEPYTDWYIDGNILKFNTMPPLATDDENNIIVHLKTYRGLQYSGTALSQFLQEKPATHYWGVAAE